MKAVQNSLKWRKKSWRTVSSIVNAGEYQSWKYQSGDTGIFSGWCSFSREHIWDICKYPLNIQIIVITLPHYWFATVAGNPTAHGENAICYSTRTYPQGSFLLLTCQSWALYRYSHVALFWQHFLRNAPHPASWRVLFPGTTTSLTCKAASTVWHRKTSERPAGYPVLGILSYEDKASTVINSDQKYNSTIRALIANAGIRVQLSMVRKRRTVWDRSKCRQHRAISVKRAGEISEW